MPAQKQKRWITGFTVGQFFNIKEKSLVKLRTALTGTPHIYRPVEKGIKPQSNFWYDLDYLINRFSKSPAIPEHLIRNM